MAPWGIARRSGDHRGLSLSKPNMFEQTKRYRGKTMDTRPTSFPTPTAMNWTVLPVRFMATCWIDDTFKQSFLRDPDTYIANRESLVNIPNGATFVVFEETPAVRHFALPYFNSTLAGMSRSAVSVLLQTETGGDTSLDWCLPADVIEEAFYNDTFRTDLLSYSAAVLRSMGYTTSGLTVHIHENTSTKFHLPLPPAPPGINASTSYETALAAAHALMV